jgi:hypothetical protein
MQGSTGMDASSTIGTLVGIVSFHRYTTEENRKIAAPMALVALRDG